MNLCPRGARPAGYRLRPGANGADGNLRADSWVDNSGPE